MTDEPPQRSLGLKFFRFSLIGFINTGIDLGLTNLLFFFFHPDSFLGLMLISVFSYSCGIISSYVLNRSWTFQSSPKTSTLMQMIRFFLVAFLTMIANTSVFLFFMKYLPTEFHIEGFLALNLAKVAGVVVGLFIGFFLSFFSVFSSHSVLEFKSRFNFHQKSASRFNLWQQTLILLLGAAVVRILFLFLTTSITGDAIHYSEIAQKLAKGDFQHIDPFWMGFYSHWEALFFFISDNKFLSTILSSLVPGILLIIPVAWISRSLYGPKVCWLAGLFCIVQPRLVSYSANGYGESLYILLLTCGIGCLTKVIQDNKSYLAAFGWGAFFALYSATRNEGFLFFLLSLILLLIIAWISSRRMQKKIILFSTLIPIVLALIGFTIFTSFYMITNQLTIETSGLFQKNMVVQKQYSEQLDLEEASKEVYGEYGLNKGPPKQKISLGESLDILLKRYPRNILYTLQRMPGILASPLYLFALILPTLTIKKGRGKAVGDETPLLMMLAFPLIFFPFFQVEPRYLFPILVPLTIFSVAGLYAFSEYLSTETKFSLSIYRIVTIGLAIFGLGTCFLFGIYIEREYQVHSNS